MIPAKKYNECKVRLIFLKYLAQTDFTIIFQKTNIVLPSLIQVDRAEVHLSAEQSLPWTKVEKSW